MMIIKTHEIAPFQKWEINSRTWELAPATARNLPSGHQDIIVTANGSSPLALFGRSNILPVFSLYRICNADPDASQNLTLPSAWLKISQE